MKLMEAQIEYLGYLYHEGKIQPWSYEGEIKELKTELEKVKA